MIGDDQSFEFNGVDLVPGIAESVAKMRIDMRIARKIRMHPLDIAMMRRRMLAQARYASSIEFSTGRRNETERMRDRLLGIELEPDCAVARGKPEVDY